MRANCSRAAADASWVVVALAATAAIASCAHQPNEPTQPVVRKLKIEGTHQVSQGRLEAGIATSATGWWWPFARKHHYDPFTWQTDLRRIERIYRAQGFFQADVVSDTVKPVKNGVELTAEVHEGEPTTIASFEVRGLEGLPEKQRQGVLRGVAWAGTFSESRWDQAKATLSDRVRNLGYQQATVEGRVLVDVNQHKADLLIVVATGPRYRFGEIEIHHEPTHRLLPVWIWEQVRLAIPEGRYYADDLVVEAQRRLTAMGVLSVAKVTVGAPNGESDRLPIVVEVREAPLHMLRTGGGVEFDQVRDEGRVIAEWSHLDFLGGMRRLTLHGEAGWAFIPNVYAVARNQADAGPRSGPIAVLRSDLEQPRFLRRPSLRGKLSLSVERTLEQAYDALGAKLAAGVAWQPWSSLSVYATYNLQGYYLNGPAISSASAAPLTLGCAGQSANCFLLLSYLEQIVSLDRRDSALEPHNGYFASIAFQEGGGPLGGSFTYFRVLPEIRGYLGLGANHVVTMSGRLRVGELFHTRGESAVVTRFFAGGGVSMRGFSDRRLSPLLRAPAPATQLAQPIELTLPVGGNGLVEGSFETRLQLTQNLIFALFLDFGQVTTGTIGPADLSSLLWAAGFGLRYKTAIGPIRIVCGQRRLLRDRRLRPGDAGDGQLVCVSRRHRGGVLMAPRAAPTRLLRAFAHFVLAALAVFLLLVLSTLLALRTPWGSRLLLAQLLPRINAEILGRVDVARLSVSPRRLTLLGLSLRDPKGKEVLKATRVQVSLSPWSLLHRVVEISSAEIVAPEVDLHIDERGGSDLSRAVAPRQHEGTSKASGTSGTERPWSFELGQLTVRDGHLSITDERAPPDSAWGSVRFRLAVFHLDGQLSGEAPARFKLDLDLRGELERPFRAPVRLSLAGASADRNASRAEANASLTIGRSTAEVGAHARLDGGLRAAEVTLDRIRVDPRLLKAVLPSSPIDTAIVGSGTLGWNGESGDVRAKVRLAAGEAKLSLAARANTNTRALDNLTLKADSVDLARLVHGAPTSDLSIECRARGAGTSLADLDGELTLRIPRGRLDGHLAGPVRLTAEATRGRLHLSELFVSAPGATLAASGTATPSALSLRGTIDLADLGALLQSISSDAKAAPAQGRGRLAFELSGSPTNPSIRVGGRLSGLAANELSLPSLSLELRVPSARNPLASALALRIPEARLGQRVFQGLSLRLAGTGPMFALHVALSRPEPVVLRIGGHWSSGHRRLSISTAQLALARATWSLRRTAELDLSEARTRLSELRLSASNQSIGIALDQRPHDLHARVSLSRLDLALLPQRLLSIPHLAGQLSADLDVRQTRASRRGKGHVDLAQARIGTIDRIDAAVDAELSGDRVDARFTLGALGARAKGQLDLPARWPPRPGSGVSADLDLTAVGLDRVMSALSRTHVFADRPMPKLVGAGSATVRMRGTAERPDVLLDLRIEGLRWQDRALGELQVGLRTGREDGLAARLALTSPSTQGLGTISLDVHGKGRPPSFLTSPNALRELAAQPIEAELHAERVALPAVAQLLGRPAVSGGTAKLSARFVGDVDQGRGDVAVDIIGFAVAGIPATDGKLRLVLREHDLQAELHVTRKQASLLSANATVRAPLARLVRSSTLAETPVELHATLGPLEWQHVGVVSAVGRPRVLHGHLGAELAVGGTLGRPNLRATAKTRDVRLDDMPAGAADALVDYEDGVLETYLTLVSSDGGRLLATASLNADLGYPAALHLPPSRELPVEASLQATRFDLAALSGLSPTLEGSTLRFSGSPELPALDVTAQYVSGEGDVTVVATVKGSPGHLETALTAPGHPELTESQLYTLVVTGHLGFGSSSSAPSTRAGQAESLLGGLLASQLQTLAANKLPFDVLTIQTGATAGSARVEAGKYVTSDLYVGYVARVGADPTLLQNRNAVHFEYALGSHWSFQGEYGDAKTGSLDLFWTKRY